MLRRQILQALASTAFLPAIFPATAQTPTARILAGFAPGTGVVDALSRLLAESMKGDYAANIIVENKIGVGGALAAAALKAAPADGTVMLLAPMSNFSVQPHIYSKIGYDPSKDFTPVGNCVTADLALAVGPAVPEQVTNVQELIAWYKTNPGKASVATGATGTKLHFAAMKLGLEAGVKLTHVGYTNGGLALNDLIGGSVPAYVGSVASVLPFVNRSRVLATMGAQRSRFLPNVPTLVEQGYKNMAVNETIGMWLPAGVPATQIQRLQAAIAKALASPEAAKALVTFAAEATPSTGTQMAAQLATESPAWANLIKQIGFRAES